MINIGKKLIGGDAAKYLPFALTKARQFAATFTNAYISRTFIVDTATVMVEVFNKDQAQVTIWGGSGGYEFFCTGPKLTKSVAYGGFSVYLGSAVRVTLVEENGVQTIKATPIGSTLLESPEKKWDYSADPEAMPDTYLAKGGWQIQGISEYVSFPRLKTKTTVTSAWCSANDTGGCNTRGLSSGYAPTSLGYDVFYDSAPLKLNSGASGGTEVVPDADWYRRATMSTIDDPKFGSRVFFLMTTISGDLVVYTDTGRNNKESENSPYGAQQIKTNIPSKYAKTVKIPMPANARRPNKMARDSLSIYDTSKLNMRRHNEDFPQYVWKFDSTGTHMACTAYYMAVEVKLGGVPIKASLARKTDNPTREELPGLVEIAISIKLTGPNPEDFTVGMEIVRDMDPFVTDRVFMHCDYTWKISAVTKPGDPAEPFDLEAINPYQQKKDDLVVAEVEVFREKGAIWLDGSFYAYGWKDAEMHHMQSDLLVKNLTTGTELRRFPLTRPACKRNQKAKTFWHDSAVVIAIDLRIMAWVIQRDIIQINSSKPELLVKVREDYDDSGDYSDNWWRNDIDGHYYDEITRATKLETWVYNKIEEEQYLSPGSPLNTLINSRAKGEGLQPSQDRKRFERVAPSDTIQLDASFPFNKGGYSIPDPYYRDQYGNRDNTIVPETSESEARRSYMSGSTSAPPIICSMFDRASEWGYTNWFANSPGEATMYGINLSRYYLGFSFRPAVWADELDRSYGLIQNGSVSFGPGLSPLPIGAFVYNLVGIPSIMVVVNDGFTAHPDGHWAVFTTPTVSYDGPTLTNLVPNPQGVSSGMPVKSIAEAGYGAAMFSIDTSKYVQGYVDIISIKSKTGRLRTSHLDQYNKAFDKNDTKEDYRIELREKEGVGHFELHGKYFDANGKASIYSVRYATKYKAIKVPTASGEFDYYVTSPMIVENDRLLDIRASDGKTIPAPAADVVPSTKALLDPGTRYHCGALMDFRPSYLLKFLGPDNPHDLPGDNMHLAQRIDIGALGGGQLVYNDWTSGSIQGPTYESAVLAGSRIFYGELRGTNRVDHEDDK